MNAADLSMLVVDEIRCTSNLGWSQCQLVAQRVLALLQDHGVGSAEEVEALATALAGDVLQVDTCSDMRDMQTAAERLGQMHADTQERSWALHEEPDTVVTFLDDLNDLIKLADPRVGLKVLQAGADGPPVSHIVELYQLEQRGTIRVALLKTLNTVSILSPRFADSLSTTTLPLDLARDLLGGQMEAKGQLVSSDPISISKRSESLKLLAHLFSTGTPVVFQNRDVISNEMLLKLCATQGEDGLRVLLAFNLQFLEPVTDSESRHNNPVVRACLAGLPENPEIGQDIISFINRGVDPIWPYQDSDLARPDPCLKLAGDILRSSNKEESVFYNNDLTVLYDVVLRNIANLPLDKRRTEFLTLLLVLCKFLSDEQKEEILFLVGNMTCRNEDLSIVEKIVAACDKKN